jgi:hypothetical protein
MRADFRLPVARGIGPRLNDLFVSLLAAEHRIDPYFRDAFDRAFQRPLVNIAQALLRRLHANPETTLCQEVPIDGEEQITDEIIRNMTQFTHEEYAHRIAERAGNTKTYGVVRGDFTVRDALDPGLRRGIFATPRTYPAWMRFAGPGPKTPPDVRDGGILSFALKLMEVEGPKLLDDERRTQDFLGISSPTFTTPNIVENVKLQQHLAAGTPVFYFLNPFDSHYLDALMQGLYARMQSSPFETCYWSCVPYLLGEGQAMKYSLRPRESTRTRIPHPIPDNWLQMAMRETLAAREVVFDFLIQLQTDARQMPIEDASIEWPEDRSPFAPVATVRVFKQAFESPEQLAFARQLRFNPWHAIAEHRPLGNQNRARRRIYEELAAVRQAMNHETHIEPTPDVPAFVNAMPAGGKVGSL